jgi:hypothetical protein
LALVNAETVATNYASIPFARQVSPSGDDAGSTFQILFASAPTATVNIQASNVDADASYVTVFTSTNKQTDAYTDIGRSAFYRVQVSNYSAGGALTVLVQR